MKKITFLLIGMFLSISLFGQTEVQDSIFIYCNVGVAEGTIFDKGASAIIDYGNGEKPKEIKFKQSGMEAFNYMIKQNWIYVDLYIYQSGAIRVIHYIFKRKIKLND